MFLTNRLPVFAYLKSYQKKAIDEKTYLTIRSLIFLRDIIFFSQKRKPSLNLKYLNQHLNLFVNLLFAFKKKWQN